MLQSSKDRYKNGKSTGELRKIVLANPSICGVLFEGCHIHHIDGDSSNDDPSNLICVTKDQHWELHRILNKKLVKHGKKCMCIETNEEYKSISHAARSNNITICHVYNSIKNNKKCKGLTFKLVSE